VKITSIEKPDPGATIWSGRAKIESRNFLWFYWPRHWLHVQEQDRRNPRCWMNVDPPHGARDQILRVVRMAKRSPGNSGK
jgi:hypothetical protein